MVGNWYHEVQGLGPSASGAPPLAGIKRHYGPSQFAGFDLVYSAGLCDHLEDKACRRLTEQLFKALKPGGKLLLSNVRMRLAGIGYLQGLLDWRPHSRRDEELLNLLLGVDFNDIAGARVIHDIGHRLAFLEASRYG